MAPRAEADEEKSLWEREKNLIERMPYLWKGTEEKEYILVNHIEIEFCFLTTQSVISAFIHT